MSGATGLDYNVFDWVFGLNEVPRDEQKELYDDLRAMERAALESMHESTDAEN